MKTTTIGSQRAIPVCIIWCQARYLGNEWRVHSYMHKNCLILRREEMVPAPQEHGGQARVPAGWPQRGEGSSHLGLPYIARVDFSLVERLALGCFPLSQRARSLCASIPEGPVSKRTTPPKIQLRTSSSQHWQSCPNTAQRLRMSGSHQKTAGQSTPGDNVFV